jgi:tRNA-splicing ligase RtcB
MKNYNFENLSPYKKQFKTPEMKIPAILHVSDDQMPNDETLEEIERVASQEYVFGHLAVMSDVHGKKGRKNPTGTVVATQNYFLPQINDTAPNCGMRFLKTNLTDEDLAGNNLNNLFNALIKTIPTKARIGIKVPYSLVMDICLNGLAPVKEFFNTRTKNEIENSYKSGNFFTGFKNISKREILDAIPELFLFIGKYRLGILGAAGNHFLDLMKISEIKNTSIAEKFGLYPGQYIFLLHTGSGLLGQYASYFYTPKEKEHLSQKIILELGKLTFNSQMRKVYQGLSKRIAGEKNNPDFFAYEDDSLEGKMFITAHRAAANYGFANRTVITHQLDKTIENTLGKNPELDLLYDTPHIFIDRENHFGRDLWIHRNGSVRANGPQRMAGHSLFSQTGEPFSIPSSMSTPAYLGVGTDQNESSFFSAGHGTGRRRIIREDAAKNKSELFQKMERRHVRLFNAKSRDVVMQDNSYYKDVEEAIVGMENNKIINVVAKMEPVAVLMY